jgi:alanyl-tRNA synthetase
MHVKQALRERFSSDPDRYYRVRLFDELGFARKRCPQCGKFFWTLDTSRSTCPEPPCQHYEFLGNPPTLKRFDYVQAWREIERFFVQHGHTSIPRYPVVCRWRPDLFFTVASIIDFQRVEGGKVVFELPANPLIVPQMCLRFNDIPNVGVSGKHYSSFCMVGQHSIAKDGGYWKERCVELDFELVRGPFGIRPEDIVFVEDVWLGYGAFGYSLEYHVKGLELGNAVFTAFEGSPDSYREIPEKVVDMGAGLERFAWITQGTPTSYEPTFGSALTRFLERTAIDYDEAFFLRYSQLAGALNLDETSDLQTAKGQLATRLGVTTEELRDRTAPLEAAYAALDHTRSLVFAIADGLLPSNTGGGHNLRVIFRRAQGLLDRLGQPVAIEELADWHIDYLRQLFPELIEHREEIRTILGVELERYEATKRRTAAIVQELRRKSTELSLADLLRLYDSDGVTPELLREQGLTYSFPPDFYVRVTERHVASGETATESVRFDLEELPPTRLLFYEDQDELEFEARVLRILDGDYLVLDRTGFYPRGGGQEPDHGTIDGATVAEVEKLGDVVLHRVSGKVPAADSTVRGQVEPGRRQAIVRHHSATHILNGASRRVLGSWVWQHSAFKDVDGARLDITHYAPLTEPQTQAIEDLANEVVRSNIPIRVEVLPRTEAERRYGMRLYQGGVVPGREVRVVRIRDFDVEACGGTHAHRTGDVGFIKIVKTERIQDGVVRVEFLAGQTAVDYARRLEASLNQASALVSAPPGKLVESVRNLLGQHEDSRRRRQFLVRRFAASAAQVAFREASPVGDLRLYATAEEGLDEEFHIAVGERAVAAAPDLIYVGFARTNAGVRLLIFSGEQAQRRGIHASEVAREAAMLLGGSGGGTTSFAQGGAKDATKVVEVMQRLPDLIRGRVGG